MANTLSAAKRARQSSVRRSRNRTTQSVIHTLERKYLALVQDGRKTEATAVLREVSSALDKAAKSNVIHQNTASRKKSRLAARLK